MSEPSGFPCIGATQRIPLLPIRSTVVFPMGATALQIAYPPNVEALTQHPEPELVVGVVCPLREEEPIQPGELEKVAVAARILNRLNLPGGTIQITLQALCRVQLDRVRFGDGMYSARARTAEEVAAAPDEAAHLTERILVTLGGVAARVERVPDEAPRILRMNMTDPARFADLAATLCHFDLAQKDAVLQRLDVAERLRYVLQQLETTWARVQRLEGRPAPDEAAPAAKTPETSEEIRRRIQGLQAELGEVDPAEKAAMELLRRIEMARLPARAMAAVRAEAERLRTLPPTGTEASEIRTYVEHVLSLPWNEVAEARHIDLDAVRAALDEEHLALGEAKRRILEVVSVAKLRGDVGGPIPCLVGPPGVGKLALAEAVARGLGRPLARVDLGGRGAAELIGGRRSRAGAQPGKLILALRDAGVRNPVLLLTELDEIGLGSVEGDPIEALEEFLEEETRDEFTDRYLDVPFDLSDVLFLGMAHDFLRIPRHLRDRFIEIRIAGYTPEEKVETARERLLPRLAEDHGLSPADLVASDEALLYLTRGYARDAGLGNLRRSLAALLRARALAKASGEAEPWTLSSELIEQVLGIPRYMSTPAESMPEVGVVTGLAWTASGGELMFIEALRMPGNGRLIFTGLLGEVMRESVSAAFSYVRSRATELGIAASAFNDFDVHIHFPVGATPKDGPSAGAAVTLAIASCLAERPVRHDVAMTGEVTLRGRILDIGGVKEKTLAAYRAGLREIILPGGNERDLREVPTDVRLGMRFHLVSQMDEVFELALLERGGTGARRRAGSRASARRGMRVVADRQGGDGDEATRSS